MGPSEAYPTDTAGLPEAVETPTVEVSSGAAFDLRVAPVSRTIEGTTVRMLAYNGSIPGPTVRVRQGTEILVNVTNETDMETTVHWHGLRLENRFDGVPHETQAPIPPGGSYTHRLTFPDAGLFWYHPHMREDYAQELGLYGNIIVDPIDPSYWPPVDREILLTLDDILIEEGKIGAFDPEHSNFTAMGRFGNVLLIGGKTVQNFEVRRGQVVRLGFTNTANTRVFKVALPGARMKLIGGDGGRYEREGFVDDVVIAPSERAIVDVAMERPGELLLQHVTPGKSYELASFSVIDGSVQGDALRAFEEPRVNADMVAERERVAAYLDAPPHKTLALIAEMDFEEPATEGPVLYVCPMHPHVVSDVPGKCPECGMKLIPAGQVVALEGGMHGHEGGHEHDHSDAMADGIEWEDMMMEVNRATTPENMRWKLVDRDTGKANADIDWAFSVGDQVKIRIVNEMASDHPMHHPFHIHGERFLVLARDGVPESNLVWKDTVLIRTGEVVDIVMDASNPGLWMAHCHIAEHMEAGMMFTFQVRGDQG